MENANKGLTSIVLGLFATIGGYIVLAHSLMYGRLLGCLGVLLVILSAHFFLKEKANTKIEE